MLLTYQNTIHKVITIDLTIKTEYSGKMIVIISKMWKNMAHTQNPEQTHVKQSLRRLEFIARNLSQKAEKQFKNKFTFFIRKHFL